MIENSLPPWLKYLCEYYRVKPEEAVLLGTRAENRKPNLPGSATTHAVKEKTFEDIWNQNPRESVSSIFDFYKEQGSWSSFRQSVRHNDMTEFHLSVMSMLLKDRDTYCEYGSGIAPFTFSLLNNIEQDRKMTIYLSDVECEHFTFGVWRCEKIAAERRLKNIKIVPKVVKADELPSYETPLHALIIFEVLEHVPSPVKVIRNLLNQTATTGLLCENFIHHVHKENGSPGPDLLSAALEREEFYNVLRQSCMLLGNNTPESHPNSTRVWQKR